MTNMGEYTCVAHIQPYFLHSILAVLAVRSQCI